MKADILLVTVNDHEDHELRAELETKGFQGRRQQSGDSLYHYTDYMKINGQKVILARSEMGSSTEGASFDTVRNAIHDYRPSMVICVGIAWGGKENQQNIGDLLISTQIQIGANAKIGESITSFRAPRPAASETAAKTLEVASQDLKAHYHKGTLISKEDLFDNKGQRDKAIKGSGAIGGEMEATGALRALDQARKDFNENFEIVVAKSICDWGYKKNANQGQKEADQKLAAQQAAKIVVYALMNYKFVKTRSIAARTAGNSENSHDLGVLSVKESLNCVEGFDFQVLSSQTDSAIPSGSIVYWPVRLRRPNMVHAAQAYVAAHLQEKGLEVKLCLDDLGNPEGYSSLKSGVDDFKSHVESWVEKVCNRESADAISKNALMFSKFIKAPDQEPDDEVFARLGKNLVNWLLESEKLKNVLRDSKLLDQDDSPQLDRKPRKLLSPSVVWTVMECVVRTQNPGQALATLGGHDEYAIWQACPQRATLSIQSIFLPKVRGNMETEALRPGTPQELSDNLEKYAEMREWVQNYLVKFPAKTIGDDEVAFKDWSGASDRELANAAFAYYR